MHALVGKLLAFVLPGSWIRNDQHLFALSFEGCDYNVKIRIIAKLCDRPETLRSFLLASKSYAAMLDDALFLKLLLQQRGLSIPEGPTLSMTRLKARFNQRRTPNQQAGSTQVKLFVAPSLPVYNNSACKAFLCLISLSIHLC